MSGLGKQLRGSGIAKIQNQRTPFAEGGEADTKDTKESSKELILKKLARAVRPLEVDIAEKAYNYYKDKTSKPEKKLDTLDLKKGGRAGYVQGGGAKVGEVKVKLPPYLKKGMVKMGLKKGGKAKK
jgi:hypothetical protein